MRKKITLGLLMILFSSLFIFLTSCSDDDIEIGGKQLSTPFISISEEGLASWNAIENAVGYTYKIDEGTEKNTNSLSVQLKNGESIVVKAVGDGTNYTDSAYSSSQTYTATTTPVEPTVLQTPVVSISNTGLTSWSQVANASSYIYKVNNGAEQTITSLSVQLADGDSIVVKAVGDGTNYTDSAYSASQTYTSTTTPVEPTNEPDFLGIFASSTEPLETDGLPSFLATGPTALYSPSQYRSLADALAEYYTNTDNHLGDTYPSESNYQIYSSENSTIYIQIWLNNPEQYTILSLKLNGTKYQVGGGLSSFFIDDSGNKYNCVYVTVTIPSGTFVEQTYEVTDIEYISNTYINQDGTDEFMNENDTVVIGLTYASQNPSITNYDRSTTYNSYNATLTVLDPGNVISQSGAWLRAVIFDGYNIVAHQKLVVGENTINVSGLLPDTYYEAAIFLYGDVHNGSGLTCLQIAGDYIHTQSVLTINQVEGVIEYDDDLDKYVGAIKLDCELISPTAEFMKVEVYDDNYETPNLITTLDDFSGVALVSKDILNGQSYNVRIYYKDTEYPEGIYTEEYVWISSLRDSYLFDEEFYSIYDDLVLSFKIGNNDESYGNVENFKLYIYNEYSSNYMAEAILAYLANPGKIDELNTEVNSLYEELNNAYGNNELMNQIYSQIQTINNEIYYLENAKNRLEYDFNNNTDVNYWQAELEKGKYAYELTYDGTDTANIIKVGMVYYIVLEDYYTMSNWSNYSCDIVANIDMNDGNGLQESEFDVYMHHSHIFTNFNGLIATDILIDENNISYKLQNQDNYDNNGEYYTTNVGYVWKIVATKGYEGSEDYKSITLFENSNISEYGTNGDQWLAAYLATIKAGEDTSDLINQYVGQYEESYSETIDLSQLTQYGNWQIHIYTKLYLENYDEENLYDYDNVKDYIKEEKIATPTLRMEGQSAIVEYPDEKYYLVYYNVKDENGELIAEEQQGGGQYDFTTVGYQVQVQLRSYEEGLTPSDWSEWVTFEGIKLDKPEVNYDLVYSLAQWNMDDNAVSCVYTLNNGPEVTLSRDDAWEVEIKNGDVLKVKFVADEASDYLDSDWTEYTCVDNREKLATPTNFVYENKFIQWDIDYNATTYQVMIVSTGEIQENAGGAIYKPTDGESYRVRAIDLNGEYIISDWSEPYTYVAE